MCRVNGIVIGHNEAYVYTHTYTFDVVVLKSNAKCLSFYGWREVSEIFLIDMFLAIVAKCVDFYQWRIDFSLIQFFTL